MAVVGCDNVEVKRIKAEDLTPEHFFSTYFKRPEPVIITGVTEDWPCRSWTLDSLTEQVGRNKVYIRGKTSDDGYRKGQRYTIRRDTFQRYVDDLKAGNARARSSYLAVASLQQAFPQLLDQVPIPEYLNYNGKLHLGPYLWVALRGHYEFCHFDPDDNFLIIIRGRKRVRMFGHSHLMALYPNPLGSYGKTIQSKVDLDNPDLRSYPAFRDLTCHHATVGPGEMLFIPAFYWHQVSALDTGISINMFFGDKGPSDFTSKILGQPYFSHFRYWFLNIVEQNRTCGSFPRILSRLREVIWHFFLKQWHDELRREQIDILVDLIREYCDISHLPEALEDEKTKHPPVLKIRGLLHRNGREAEGNEDKYSDFVK